MNIYFIEPIISPNNRDIVGNGIALVHECFKILEIEQYSREESLVRFELM